MTSLGKKRSPEMFLTKKMAETFEEHPKPSDGYKMKHTVPLKDGKKVICA